MMQSFEEPPFESVELFPTDQNALRIRNANTTLRRALTRAEGSARTWRVLTVAALFTGLAAGGAAGMWRGTMNERLEQADIAAENRRRYGLDLLAYNGLAKITLGPFSPAEDCKGAHAEAADFKARYGKNNMLVEGRICMAPDRVARLTLKK